MSACIQCNLKPQYPGHQYCGKTCANAAAATKAPANPAGNCIHCHKKPKYAGHPYCGKTCASAAAAVAATSNATATAANPPAAPNVSTNATSNSGNNCIQCHVKPKYSGHQYCGKTCAKAAAAKAAATAPNPLAAANVSANATTNSGSNCIQCHVKPKYSGHQYCGKSCAKAAAAASASTPASANGANVSANPAGNCIQCKVKPKFNGHPYCGKSCANAASASAPAGPALVQLQPSDDRYVSVSNQFKVKWKGTAPQIRHIYQVIPAPSVKQAYEAYRNTVDSSPHFTRKPGMSPGNEQRRWHGTKRTCQLGDNPTQTTFCSNQGCALCSILRTTLRMPAAGRYLSFGTGIYTSSTPSKAAGYSSSPSGAAKTLILFKIVVGKGFKRTTADTTIKQPPAGHDSILGEVADDELIVFRSDATCPAYLVVYN